MNHFVSRIEKSFNNVIFKTTNPVIIIFKIANSKTTYKPFNLKTVKCMTKTNRYDE